MNWMDSLKVNVIFQIFMIVFMIVILLSENENVEEENPGMEICEEETPEVPGLHQAGLHHHSHPHT